jgi:hypothetical protein
MDEQNTPLPKIISRDLIREAIRVQLKDEWLKDDRFKHTKHFYAQPDALKAKHLLKFSKASVSRLVKIITGHNFLSYFQFQLDCTINPLCRLCEQANETFYHFLTECDALANQRREFFLDKEPSTDNWRPRQIVKFSLTEPINSWFTNRDYLLEQPMLELDINYSITDSDNSC